MPNDLSPETPLTDTTVAYTQTVYDYGKTVYDACTSTNSGFAPYEYALIILILFVALQWLLPYISTITFGWIKIQTLASLRKDADHDSRIRDLVDREINIIDYETRRRMRDAARKVTLQALAKFPDCADAVLRGRVAIATSICDNHITYDLNNNVDKFIAQKVEACEVEVYRSLNTKEEEALIWTVVHWVFEVMHIQARAVETKLKVYYKAHADFALERFKSTAQGRIDKNLAYQQAINMILSHDMDSVILKKGMIDTVSAVRSGSREAADSRRQTAGEEVTVGTASAASGARS